MLDSAIDQQQDWQGGVGMEGALVDACWVKALKSLQWVLFREIEIELFKTVASEMLLFRVRELRRDGGFYNLPLPS